LTGAITAGRIEALKALEDTGLIADRAGIDSLEVIEILDGKLAEFS
jgi:hypothetical protein